MKFKVNAYSLTPLVTVAGVQGSRGTESLSFDFDSSWDGFAKKVVFFLPDGTSLIRSYHGGDLMIPKEVLDRRGKSKFVIVGRKGKKRQITVCASLLVLGTPLCEETGETL